MVPNKLEKQIREKMNSREIQPSAQAWDRLDEMLKIAEQNNIQTSTDKKNKFRWFFIAASCIGFIFIVTIVFTTNFNTHNGLDDNNKIKKVIVVSSEIKSKNRLNKSEKIITSKDDNANLITNKNNANSNKIKINKVTKSPVSIIKNNQNQIAISSNNEHIDLIKNENKLDLISSQNLNSETIHATENQENKPLIELKKADKYKLKIDANNLLSQVESELKIEYRENIFQKIAKNIQTAKVAFNERNIKK